jgi:hypothetical protein
MVPYGPQYAQFFGPRLAESGCHGVTRMKASSEDFVAKHFGGVIVSLFPILITPVKLAYWFA